MKNGSHEQGFALVIAHYNYLLRCVVSGLRDFQSPRPLDQRVTLSLDSPLREAAEKVPCFCNSAYTYAYL